MLPLDAADKNLSQRTKFSWFVLRPGSLADDSGTGKVALGVHQGLDHKVSGCMCGSSPMSLTNRRIIRSREKT